MRPQGRCPADFKESRHPSAGLGFPWIPGLNLGCSGGRRLSTAGLYELFASRGQAVDKKTTFRSRKTYPQPHPHPQGHFYRGFQPYISLYIQTDNLLFNQIWPYHHHIALDLYTDLKLGHRVSGHFTRDGRRADAERREIREFGETQTRMACHYQLRRNSPRMLHVEHAKRNPAPGRVSGDASFHVEPGMTQVRDAAASPHDATFRCWLHAPAPRSSNRAAE